VSLAIHRLGNGWLIKCRCRFSGERRERCAQGRIRCRDAVIAMPMKARRGDEGGEPVDKFQGLAL
jgi:hypothetical protein